MFTGKTVRSRRRPPAVSISVDLDLPPRERWVQPGRAIAPMVRDLSENALEVAGEILPSFFRPLIGADSSLKAHAFCRTISAELTEEAIGLSEATGVPVTQLVLANCTYDFTQLCSAAVYKDPLGRPVMIRNMDWDLPAGIGRYTIVVNYVRSGVPAYSSLGFAGFLGVVTAFSPRWALAMNQAPSDHVRALPAVKKAGILTAAPTTFAMRQICDHASTFDDLNRRLMKVRTMTPFLALTCGAKSGEGTRIERPGRGKATATDLGDENPLVLTNHYLHERHRELNGPSEWVDDDGNSWPLDSSGARFCKMGELALRFAKKESLPSLTSLRSKPIFWDATVHTAVMRPATGEFRYANHLHGCDS
jgi:hypothetical protein